MDESTQPSIPDATIRAEQIRILFTQGRAVLLMSVAVAFVETLVLWGKTNKKWLLIWFSGFVIVTILRFSIYLAYQRAKPQDDALSRWLNLNLAGIALGGMMWGANSLLVTITPDVSYQGFILIIVGGIIIGALSSHAVILRAYLIFLTSSLLMVAVWQVTRHTPIGYGISVTIILLFITLGVTARRYEDAFLSGLRMRFENLDLLKQAKAANQAKSAFLANMSHEIRTPLTTIIGYADSSLAENTKVDDQVNALKIIKRSGDHLLGIISDILDFSKIEADELHIAVDRHELFPLLADVYTLVNYQADNKGLILDFQYDYPLPEFVNTDAIRFKQILINLCSNAIKFTQHGRIIVHFRCKPASEQLLVDVVDTGIGMNADQLANIFKPFRQADNSITRRYGGTGLGLVLCKRLAELLGGNIQVASQMGQGSTFTLVVPVGPLTDVKWLESMPEIKAVIESINQTETPKLTGRILLAEDNAINQQLIKGMLEKMGAQVDVADNGQIAVEKAQQIPYDLIYMDMQMPVMSGVDATKQLRAQDYRLPIVALTANVSKEDQTLCLDAGCNDFFTKPVLQQTLYRMTSRYLTTRSAPTQGAPIVSDLLAQQPDLRELVTKFVAGLPHTVSLIQQDYASQNWLRLQHLVHDLKGIGTSMGYPMLSELAIEIESLLKSQSFSGIAPLLDKLTSVSARIRVN